MNVLEKILEEIEGKMILVATSKEHYNQPQNGKYVEEVITIKDAENIIRSHMNEIPNCEGCSRRKWYQKGFEDGKKDNDWIPVEEKLPEEGTGQLIVTDKDGNVYMNITYGYAEDDDKEPTFHSWDEEWWYCYKYRVVAWRLKPEPYIKNPK